MYVVTTSWNIPMYLRLLTVGGGQCSRWSNQYAVLVSQELCGNQKPKPWCWQAQQYIIEEIHQGNQEHQTDAMMPANSYWENEGDWARLRLKLPYPAELQKQWMCIGKICFYDIKQILGSLPWHVHCSWVFCTFCSFSWSNFWGLVQNWTVWKIPHLCHIVGVEKQD